MQIASQTLSSLSSTSVKRRTPDASQPAQVNALEPRGSLCPAIALCMDVSPIRQNAVASVHTSLQERRCACANCKKSLLNTRPPVSHADRKNNSSTLGEPDTPNASQDCDEARVRSGSQPELPQDAGQGAAQRVSCQNADAGDVEQGPPQDSAGHQESCDTRQLQHSSRQLYAPHDNPHSKAHTVLPAGNTTPEEDLTECGKGCGQKLSRRKIKAHYAFCPRALVCCPDCNQPVVRQKLGTHVLRFHAEEPPLSLEDEATAEKLLRNGAGRLQSSMSLEKACTYCENTIPSAGWDRHEKTCGLRPVDCAWCLETHPADTADQLSTSCHEDCARPVTLNKQVLQLAKGASGPVYLLLQGIYNPVFIKLPLKKLLSDKAADRQIPCSSRLAFTWAGTQWHMMTVPESKTSLCVHLIPKAGETAITAKVQLYSDAGSVLQEWGAARAGQDVRPFLPTTGGKISFCVNTDQRISANGGSHVFFKLISCSPASAHTPSRPAADQAGSARGPDQPPLWEGLSRLMNAGDCLAAIVDPSHPDPPRHPRLIYRRCRTFLRRPLTLLRPAHTGRV
ncbi:MAG: hypothetical protein OXC07_01530 [Kistimonas sp.]|nr:hypothetical protein [Kistimonas sp.]